MFARGTFLSSGIRVELGEGGLLILSPPPPGIIITAIDQQPVQPFDINLPYVVDYLHREIEARVVIATFCRFGWENLWVRCICLYVDAEATEYLAESASTQSIPTIIMRGTLRDATGRINAIAPLLEPPNLDKVAIGVGKLH